jgi:hypothetical protein
MAEQLPLRITNLFADGGELLQKIAEHEPTEEVLTLAMDGEHVEVREDSFQIVGLKGGKFEIHGVFVDGAQIWRHTEALEDAERNITSIYARQPGPARLLRPLFDRDLAIGYSLRHDVANRGIRTRVQTDSDGKILDYETDIVRVKVNPMTHKKCGKLILSRKHGAVVKEATESVLTHFGFESEDMLTGRDGETSHQTYERVSSVAQNAFANLINATFAFDAGQNNRPWIYKATHPKIGPADAASLSGRTYYTTDKVNHFHVDGLYCKISPAFREFVALTTQSLARFYLAGGSPDDVNQEVLDALVIKINEGYKNVDAVQEELEEQRLQNVA